MPGAYLWGWDGAAAWRKVRTDVAGHLQVDVITAGPTEGRCYGYAAPNWHEVKVESAANPNLRVRLYAASFAIAAAPLTNALATINAQTGLYGRSQVFIAYDANRASPLASGYFAPDGTSGALNLAVALYGWTGATWWKLRTYGTGILKVGRGEVGLSDLRRTTAGTVKASAGKLYWMTMNPTAANSIVELSDDLDGSGAIKWDMTHGVNSSHHMNLDPPLEFSTGIYLKTLTNMTSIIFGYL